MSHVYTKQGTYFQFPLCAFAYGRTVDERLNAIINFGCRFVGRAEWLRMNEAERTAWRTQIRQSPKRPPDLRLDDADDIALTLGAQIIGVTYSSLGVLRRGLVPFDRFLADYQAEHGRDSSVRIKRSYLFEARDGGGISYRELSVLAAILSIVGRRRKPVRITQDSIRRRAQGYRSAAIYQQARPARPDGEEALTAWKLRATLDALRRRRLVHRLTFRRRLTYYGVGMTAKEFEEAVFDLLTRPAGGDLLRRSEADEFDSRVLNARAARGGLPPPFPHSGGNVVPAWEDPAENEAANPAWPEC